MHSATGGQTRLAAGRGRDVRERAFARRPVEHTRPIILRGRSARAAALEPEAFPTNPTTPHGRRQSVVLVERNTWVPFGSRRARSHLPRSTPSSDSCKIASDRRSSSSAGAQPRMRTSRPPRRTRQPGACPILRPSGALRTLLSNLPRPASIGSVHWKRAQPHETDGDSQRMKPRHRYVLASPQGRRVDPPAAADRSWRCSVRGFAS